MNGSTDNNKDDDGDSTDTEFFERKMPARSTVTQDATENADDDSDNESDKEEESPNSSDDSTLQGPRAYVIYEPTFRSEWINKANNGEMESDEVHELFLKKDWLTEGLCREIINHRPKPHEINPNTGKRDEVAFEKACSTIFAEGRIFASSLQLQQAARKFLDQ